MNNLQRVELEVRGVELGQNELIVYLQENGLNPHDEYNPQSLTAKRAIYQTAQSVLEGIANNPDLMKSIKMDDMTISDFHENLMARIDHLEKKIRKMKTDTANTDIFMLFM